jgi:hypothetical protein
MSAAEKYLTAEAKVKEAIQNLTEEIIGGDSFLIP